MNPEILSIKEEDGALSLQIRISADEFAAARAESREQLAFEHGLPADADVTQLMAPPELVRFETEYTLSKAVNLAVAEIGVKPCASNEINSSGLYEVGKPYEFIATVFPRPAVVLTSAEPISLEGKRIPAPGESLADAAAGKEVKYVADDRMLQIELLKRVRADISDTVLSRAVTEYGQTFAANLQRQGSTIEDYCAQMNMNEEQFSGLMTIEASKQLKLDLALEAIFDAQGLEISGEDVEAVLDRMMPGKAAELRRLYEQHGDLYVVEGQARRLKAIEWLRANVS